MQNVNEFNKDSMQYIDTHNLQITYYNNMEFFKSLNPKLFSTLTNNPKEYNLHVDSYGINIIHLPTQKIHYPIIPKLNAIGNVANISPQTHTTSMQESHKDVAINPMKNNKWNLFANFNLNINSQFIDENKLHITGKYCNDMLRDVLKRGLAMQDNRNNEIHTNHFELSKHSNMALFNNLLESFEDSKFMPQTIIYGLMGGLFLQQLLDEEYFFHSLLIYEDNIDLFRISLYFVDYNKLFKQVDSNACFIVIKDISLPLVRAFLHTKKITNNILSLELKHYNTRNVELLQDFIFKEKKAIMRGWGSFEDEILGFNNACKNLKQCKLLHSNIQRVNAPICVVGNGASLDLCIDFIKNNQDNMIIISCGTALKVLRHHDIKPDFQLEIERVPYLWEVLKEADLGDIPLIFAQTTDFKSIENSQESYGFFRGGSSSAYLDSSAIVIEFSAPFVGNAGVALASFLGSDCILCGIDCGYIEGYSKHAKHSFYGTEDTKIPNDCFKVDGNKDLNVYSNDLFYMSAKNIEEAIKLYKPNSVINMGYGMKFNNTISLNEDDFTLKQIDKKEQVRNFKLLFRDYSLLLDIDSIIDVLDNFYKQIQKILLKEPCELKDIFVCVDSIVILLQKYIMNVEYRKSIILLEGSILHLCFTFLISCLFAKDSTYYTLFKSNLSNGIESIINHCKKTIQNLHTINKS